MIDNRFHADSDNILPGINNELSKKRKEDEVTHTLDIGCTCIILM